MSEYRNSHFSSSPGSPIFYRNVFSQFVRCNDSDRVGRWMLEFEEFERFLFLLPHYQTPPSSESAYVNDLTVVWLVKFIITL